MCGVVGLFHAAGRPTPETATLRMMADALRHRGPDGDGYHVEPGIGLGHRRLAIVDLGGGVQPMCNEDGTVHVTFNGEIYNHEELRRELEGLGHQFRTRSDTEAIVHGWEEWGLGCLQRLRGQFAFAVWDRNRGKLLLARDRLGEKPLHYAWLPDGTLAFSSELSGLLVLPSLSRKIDPVAIDDYFAYGYIPDPGTVFAGVRKLEAGHFLLLERGAARAEAVPYWQPPTADSEFSEDPAERLTAMLRTCVRDRLMADVPLGCFLSGGVDSSAVVAFAAEAARPGPLATFTIGFPGASDERQAAAEVAAHFGTRHRDEEGTADYIEAARSIARVFGEPFGDHSAVPTLKVCALARRHVTVALSGDGGDEVFAGYRRYRWHMLAEGVRRFMPASARRRVIGGLAQIYPKLDRAPRWLRAKHTLTEISLDSALGYYRTVCRVHQERRRGLFSPALRGAVDGHDPSSRIRTAMEACDSSDPLRQAQYADLTTYLPGDILTKVDRTSMAVSLEVRPPLLDHDLVAWGLGLPAPLKLRGDTGKQVLRQAIAPLLPKGFLDRPKQGFAASIGGQLRTQSETVRQRLLGEVMLDSGYFEQGALARLESEHASGRFDHSQALWQLLAFEGFLSAASSASVPVKAAA